MESLTAGTFVGAGSFRCQHCGYALTLEGTEVLTAVPELRRPGVPAGLAVQHRAHLAHRGGAADPRRARASPRAPDIGARLEQARGEARPSPATTSCYEDGDELRTIALTREWTRIGRSLAADVRFDDPTVSRRHALIVHHARRRAPARRPQPQRRVRQRRADRRARAAGRRRDHRRALPPELPARRRRVLDVPRGRLRAGLVEQPSASPRLGAIRLGDAARREGDAATGLHAAPPSVVSGAMAKTIAVLSQKGGTGKTTTVRTLTDVLRRAGLRTLAVDLDPQGNLSDYFDLPTDAEPTIADVLLGPLGARRGDPRATSCPPTSASPRRS